MINAQISSRRLLVNCSCLLTQSNVFQINSIFIVLKRVGLVVLRKKKKMGNNQIKDDSKYFAFSGDKMEPGNS